MALTDVYAGPTTRPSRRHKSDGQRDRNHRRGRLGQALAVTARRADRPS